MAGVCSQFVLQNGQEAQVIVGPFLDSNGRPLTELVIEQADVLISQNCSSFAMKTDANASDHMVNGFYLVKLAAADTLIVGPDRDNILTISINISGALPVWKDVRIEPSSPA